MSEPIHTRWVVITGAPSSGKTTLVNELDRRGFKVLHEAARMFIETEMGKGRSIQDLREDERAFQTGILDAKLQAEGALCHQDLVFLDRAIPDTVTYFKLAGLDPSEMEPISHTYVYQTVFVLDPLDFEQDGVRIESEAETAFLDQEFERDYRRLGFHVVRVPVMPIEARVAFILERVENP